MIKRALNKIIAAVVCMGLVFTALGGTAAFANTISPISEKAYGNPYKLTGDLSDSSSDFQSYLSLNRESILTHWKRHVVNNFQSFSDELMNMGISTISENDFTMDMDGYNIQENEEDKAAGRVFQQRTYDLIRILEVDEPKIAELVRRINGNPEFVLEKIREARTAKFNFYGYYEVKEQPYIRVPALFAYCGGVWKSTAPNWSVISSGNSAAVQGTDTFNISPAPYVHLFYQDDQVYAMVRAFGNNSMFDPKIIISSQHTGRVSREIYSLKDYIKTRNDGSTYVAEDAIRLDSIVQIADNLGGEFDITGKIDDGFGRTDMSPIDLPFNDVYVAPDSFSVTPGMPQEPGTHATVTFKVGNHEAHDVATKLAYRLGNAPAEYIDVELKPNEEKSINVFVAYPQSNTTFVANINPNRKSLDGSPLEEYDYENNRSEWDITVKGTDLVLKQLQVESPVPVNSNVPVKATVQNDSLDDHNVLVRFYADKDVIGEKSVYVPAGGQNDVSINWTAPSRPANSNIVAVCNPDSEIRETDRSNNSKDKLVRVYANSGSGGCINKTSGEWDTSYRWITGYGKTEVCTLNGSTGEERCHSETDYSDPIYTTKVVTYSESMNAKVSINTKQGIPTDPDNPKSSDRESRGSWEIIPYAQRHGLDANQITRAGYGFEVKVNVQYNTNWESLVPGGATPYGGGYTGPDSVAADIYDSRGNYVTTLNMVQTGGTVNNSTWELPMRNITTVAGEVFNERKFYTEVNAPDGEYTVHIHSVNGNSKTNLSFCIDQTVQILGSMYDDAQNIRQD